MEKFCGKCGKKLKRNGKCPKCDEKNGIRKIILIIVMMLFIIVGVGVFFFINDIDLSYVIQKLGIRINHTAKYNPMEINYVPEQESIEYDKQLNVYYSNNILIVFFTSDIKEDKVSGVIEYLNGEIVGCIPELEMYQIKLSEEYSVNELKNIADDVMKKFEMVLYATYDTAVASGNDTNNIIIPNDPWEDDVDKTDWNDNDVDGSNWWIEAVEVNKTWNYNAQFSEINIGICDSSFDIGHEDLKNKCSFPNEVLKSRNIITPWWNDWNKETKNIGDQDNYHGTHVAGIIGAELNNKKGINGIVDNCNLLLAPYYCDENAQEYLWWDSSTYANLAYLVEAGAKVINFSQGKTNFLTAAMNSYSDEFLLREGNMAAISIAKLLEEGHDFVVVQSAGNGNGETHAAVDAFQNGWFACITEKNITASDTIDIEDVRNRVIIVGAAEQNNNGYQCTSFSNYGKQVDICAPGEKIYSTVPGETFYDFEFWGGYGYASGTSMSAPIVTGVCGLVWSINTNLSGEQVKKIVCSNTGVNVSSNPNVSDKDSYKMVNAKKAIDAAVNYKKNDQENNILVVPTQIPSNAVFYNGHYYYLYSGGIASTYEEAMKYCNDKGGYLATLTSKEENDFVYSYIKQQNCQSAYFGLYEDGIEGNWKWSTGENVFYTNWSYGEPNNENNTEKYGMFYYKYGDGYWNDGDFGISRTDGGKDFICEWGEYSLEQQKVSNERNIALVLDVSGSMSGAPLDETKKASNNFINTILEEDASIGLIAYDDQAEYISSFSNSKTLLQSAVTGLSSGGSTNIEDGLSKATNMLNSTTAKKKIIVLMSDGEPNTGREGEELIAYANEIKEQGILIYTLGFFESLGQKSSAQQLMEGIASDGCHYEVASADDLVFFFEDMADQINGQKYIYVRIACPVDVSVTYNGQTLSSSENELNLRTEFGTLTFEESEEETSENEDDRIKVLRLKEGVDYDIQIDGTGHGFMNYTIGFMDEEGDYDDFRTFENIKITRRTKIDTVAAVSSESILNIDEDGDGKYDLKLKAEANGYGEEVKIPEWIFIVIGLAVTMIIIDIFILIILKKCKNKRRKADN